MSKAKNECEWMNVCLIVCLIVCLNEGLNEWMFVCFHFTSLVHVEREIAWGICSRVLDVEVKVSKDTLYKVNWIVWKLGIVIVGKIFWKQCLKSQLNHCIW